MNNENPQQDAARLSAETPPAPLPFSATGRERICALLMYPAAYFYAMYLDGTAVLPIVAVLLVGIAELLYFEIRRSPESFVWLGCFVCAVAGSSLHRADVWDKTQQGLFVHVYFVWWVLSRSGTLLEGRSGHFLPVDAVNGFLVFPFGHFGLRIRTAAYAVRQLFTQKDREKRSGWGWVAGAAVLCMGLFIGASKLLLAADEGFRALLAPMEDWLRFDWDPVVWLRLALSLPVGAWLFGLLGGAGRTETARLEKQRGGVEAFLGQLQKVPAGFWTAVIGSFSLLYLVFFAVQGRYLFGAFTRTLPEGFIVSEYARQGFFELCKVMAMNFALLWVVTRMASPEAGARRSFRVGCALLLAESMVFAVIALSKLGLYISCFGLTPLRLQSSWLVCVLFAGCALWLYHLLTGRPAMRKWMIFGAVTMSVLCLV